MRCGVDMGIDENPERLGRQMIKPNLPGFELLDITNYAFRCGDFGLEPIRSRRTCGLFLGDDVRGNRLQLREWDSNVKESNHVGVRPLPEKQSRGL